MKLIDLQRVVNEAVERAGDTAEHVTVEVWTGQVMRRIEKVSQFSVVPDLLLHLGEVEMDFTEQEKGECESA